MTKFVQLGGYCDKLEAELIKKYGIAKATEDKILKERMPNLTAEERTEILSSTEPITGDAEEALREGTVQKQKDIKERGTRRGCKAYFNDALTALALGVPA